MSRAYTRKKQRSI